MRRTQGRCLVTPQIAFSALLDVPDREHGGEDQERAAQRAEARRTSRARRRRGSSRRPRARRRRTARPGGASRWSPPAEEVEERDGEGEQRDDREQRQVGERVGAQQQLIADEALADQDRELEQAPEPGRTGRAEAARGSRGVPRGAREAASAGRVTDYSETWSSTRRFSARPSRVSLLAIGPALAVAGGREPRARRRRARSGRPAPRWRGARTGSGCRRRCRSSRCDLRSTPPSSSSPRMRTASSRITAASGRMFDLSKSKFTPRSTIFSAIGAGAGWARGAGAGAGGGGLLLLRERLADEVAGRAEHDARRCGTDRTPTPRRRREVPAAAPPARTEHAADRRTHQRLGRAVGAAERGHCDHQKRRNRANQTEATHRTHHEPIPSYHPVLGPQDGLEPCAPYRVSARAEQLRNHDFSPGARFLSAAKAAAHSPKSARRPAISPSFRGSWGRFPSLVRARSRCRTAIGRAPRASAAARPGPIPGRAARVARSARFGSIAALEEQASRPAQLVPGAAAGDLDAPAPRRGALARRGAGSGARLARQGADGERQRQREGGPRAPPGAGLTRPLRPCRRTRRAARARRARRTSPRSRPRS